MCRALNGFEHSKWIIKIITSRQLITKDKPFITLLNIILYEPACWPSALVIAWFWADAAIARFIKISLHSSAVRCSGPMGLKCVLPPLVVVKIVCVFVSRMPFAIEWDWSDWSIRTIHIKIEEERKVDLEFRRIYH